MARCKARQYIRSCRKLCTYCTRKDKVQLHCKYKGTELLIIADSTDIADRVGARKFQRVFAK